MTPKNNDESFDYNKGPNETKWNRRISTALGGTVSGLALVDYIKNNRQGVDAIPNAAGAAAGLALIYQANKKKSNKQNNK